MDEIGCDIITDFNKLEELIKECLDNQFVMNHMAKFDAVFHFHGTKYSLELQINKITRR